MKNNPATSSRGAGAGAQGSKTHSTYIPLQPFPQLTFECEPPATLQALARDHRFNCQLQLVREHWGAVRRLWLHSADCLGAARIHSNLPDDFLLGVGMPGIASIKPARDERFEFAEDGLIAVIVPAYDTIPGHLDTNAERHVEHLIDLVAVDLDRPDKFWRRRDEALILGSAYLDIAGQEGVPSSVFRNPMSWLKAGGAGIVVFDWDWARDLLLDLQVVAEDLDLADRLEAALGPDIWVMEAAA